MSPPRDEFAERSAASRRGGNPGLGRTRSAHAGGGMAGSTQFHGPSPDTGFDAATHDIRPAPATRLVDDGDEDRVATADLICSAICPGHFRCIDSVCTKRQEWDRLQLRRPYGRPDVSLPPAGSKLRGLRGQPQRLERESGGLDSGLSRAASMPPGFEHQPIKSEVHDSIRIGSSYKPRSSPDVNFLRFSMSDNQRWGNQYGSEVTSSWALGLIRSEWGRTMANTVSY